MISKQVAPSRWQVFARDLWLSLLFVGLYLAGAELGHLFSFSKHFPTLWPPSGILLAGLLISEFRRWPVIIALALFANLISDLNWNGYNLSFSLGHWLITATEASLGAWFLRRLCAFPFHCDSLREVLGLSLVSAVLVTFLGALAGEELFLSMLPKTEERLGWAVCWNSHMLGVILFAPMILTLVAKRPQWLADRPAWHVAAEACVAFTTLTVFANLVYSEQTQPYAFLVFPVLIWIALRFELWGTCASNMIRVGISIWSTRLGQGPFAGDYPATEQAIILGSFLCITSATSLFLTAVVSERRRAAVALQQSELRYRDLLENIGDLVHSVNAEGQLLYTNRAWRETLGYSLEETRSLSIFELVHPDDLDQYCLKLAYVLSGQNAERYEFRFFTKDGRTLVFEGTCNCRVVEGQPNATRSISRDVTGRREHEAQLDQYRQQLEAVNSQLHRLATTDSLTGLNNRRAFHARLEEETERAGRHGHELSLLMVDVDHFKRVNDLFGHPAGDLVLQQVAQVLQTSAREYDCVARVGGEEFAVILPQTTRREAVSIAERIRGWIETIPFSGGRITASFGVATLSAVGLVDDESELIKDADAALYHSKEHGRNRVTHAASLAEWRGPSQGEPIEASKDRCELIRL